MTKRFQELIYLENQADYNEVKEAICGKFEDAEIVDASDSVHPFRFEVYLPHDKEDDFRVFSILEGFATCGLGFEFMRRGKENEEKIREWLEKAKGIKNGQSNS